MVYFVSGHRDITENEFKAYYEGKLEKAYKQDRNAVFVLGNSPGLDTLAIEYFEKNNIFYKVYQYEDELPSMKCGMLVKKFDDADERDAFLTRISDIDIAYIRKGKEDSCTAKNILRRHIMGVY